MNKKNLLIATMALPLFMAACSSEDVLTEVQDNNQFPGVAKVNAQFNIGNDTQSRLATAWGLEENDVIGLAWLGDVTNVTIDGKAYQNHPLYAVGSGTDATLQPKTSIYVGKYFSYAPYDYSTKSVGKINFTIAEQSLKSVADDGINAAAAKSIWISPKWTDVTVSGWEDENDNVYDNAGVSKTFKMYPRKFSNMVQLVLTYVNNELAKAETPDIKGIKVSYGDNNSVVAFTYAPTKEVVSDMKDFTWENYTLSKVEGLTANGGEVVLNGKYLAEGEGNTFVYNALPANVNVSAETLVKLELTTTYGVVYISKPLSEIAKSYIGEPKKYDDLFDGEVSEDGKTKGVEPVESFVSVLGKNGKLIAEVDFLTAIMDGMHVENDAELQKMLNYYKNYKMDEEVYSESKIGTDIKLYLDGQGASCVFELSKTSIDLIREINKDCVENELNVSIQPCKQANPHYCSAIKLTGGGELPEMDKVFEDDITAGFNLSNEAWTWAVTPTDVNGNVIGKNFGKVKTITTGEGTLTLSNKNIVTVDESVTITNTGNIIVDAVANVKQNVTNMGTITINEDAEMLAYGSTILNQSLSYTLNDKLVFNNYKIINNGVLGVVKGTNGVINNYGYIKNNEGARTYVTTNQTSGAKFSNPATGENKIGIIELTNWNDNVSVSNDNTEGFIKYTWNGTGVYTTPTPEADVKYNYLIVDKDIEFKEFEKEVMYLEVAEGSNIVITAVNVFDTNHRLNGLILGKGATADIKKSNSVYANAAYIHEGKLYVGGNFKYGSDLTTYLGGVDKDTDNIVEY